MTKRKGSTASSSTTSKRKMSRSTEKKKRHRRTAAQIDRKFPCSYCEKGYGTDNALKLHVKNKHPNMVGNRKGNKPVSATNSPVASPVLSKKHKDEAMYRQNQFLENLDMYPTVKQLRTNNQGFFMPPTSNYIINGQPASPPVMIPGSPINMPGSPRGGLTSSAGSPINMPGSPLSIPGSPIMGRNMPINMPASPSVPRNIPLNLSGSHQPISGSPHHPNMPGSPHNMPGSPHNMPGSPGLTSSMSNLTISGSAPTSPQVTPRNVKVSSPRGVGQANIPLLSIQVGHWRKQNHSQYVSDNAIIDYSQECFTWELKTDIGLYSMRIPFCSISALEINTTEIASMVLSLSSPPEFFHGLVSDQLLGQVEWSPTVDFTGQQASLFRHHHLIFHISNIVPIMKILEQVPHFTKMLSQGISPYDTLYFDDEVSQISSPSSELDMLFNGDFSSNELFQEEWWESSFLGSAVGIGL